MLVLKPTARLALEDDITLQGIPELDHFYAFDVKSGDHYQLNHTAHWMLAAIGNGINFQELLEKFKRAYNLRQDTAERDLAEIILYAVENHLIKEITP